MPLDKQALLDAANAGAFRAARAFVDRYNEDNDAFVDCADETITTRGTTDYEIVVDGGDVHGAYAIKLQLEDV